MFQLSRKRVVMGWCLIAFAIIISMAAAADGTERDAALEKKYQPKSRSIPNLQSRFIPAYENNDDNNTSRITIENMTCDFFEQPLNHFVPRGRSPMFLQRYCVYDEFATGDGKDPILFYTGNESPLEQYINHTGLMWELAPHLNARVVFVEHRYEGQSLPPANLTKDCMSYGSTIQALADYANILDIHLNPKSLHTGPRAPVIAFGGSYGGMLSAWMRMKYPHLITGAIAASAPIGAFPQAANHKIDGSARVLAHGLQQSYPPDKKSDEPNHCVTNLHAAWPLLTWLVQHNGGPTVLLRLDAKNDEHDVASFLQKTFRLCEPYAESSERPLIDFLTSLWFDLAEGSFPYPSSYIPFALMHKKVNLPAWPMQAACWNSGLNRDWGVVVAGDIEKVRYNISYGDSNLTLSVDWEKMKASSSSNLEEVIKSKDVRGLLDSIRQAVSVWHNVTKDVSCFDVSNAAPNQGSSLPLVSKRRAEVVAGPDISCRAKIQQVGSWEPVCCNDEMDLVITEAQGMGHDLFWPPSVPRSVSTYNDMMLNKTMGPCQDPDGNYGYSKENYDPFSTWLETYYGSSDLNGHSNIIFSNGLLDPWAAGGVYTDDPFQSLRANGQSSVVSVPTVQNITDTDVVAVLIEYGGHHTDLMYSHKLDPDCVTKARELEKAYILKWIDDWSEASTNVDSLTTEL